MNVIDFVGRLGQLDAVKKPGLLSQLAFQCSIAARAAYVEAGCSPSDAARQLRGYNEVLLIVNSELDAAINEPSRARTPQDFASAVEHWMNTAGINRGMEHACTMVDTGGTHL